jgi:hypothetical protein
MHIWTRVWFRAGSATNLAAARIIIGTHALWMLLSRDFAGVSALPLEFWEGARQTARWRYLLFPHHEPLEQTLYVIAVVCLAGVVCGVYPRLACLASALLLYHLAPLETIIWTPNPYERGLDIAVVSLVVLAVSPCADVWTLVATRRHQNARSPSDYHWPVMAIQLVIAQVYLFAGYAKLYRVGWDWISAENLRRWLLVFNQQDQIAVFDRLGPWLAQSDSLTFLIAVATVALDFGFVAALFSRWRGWLVATAVLFHAGILVSMNIAFLNLPQLLVFLDWQHIGERWRGSTRRFGGVVA